MVQETKVIVMSPRPPSKTAIRVADLRPGGGNGFDLRPTKEDMTRLASELDLSAIRKLVFSGDLRPVGKTDWRLSGTLGATVVQPCVSTLEPVTTRIDTAVERTYVADYKDPDAEEFELTDEDTIEPLGAWIDPAQVMQEALILAAPDYPRATDAAPADMVYTKPGAAAMTDEDAKPFAGLAGLKDALEKGDD